MNTQEMTPDGQGDRAETEKTRTRGNSPGSISDSSKNENKRSNTSQKSQEGENKFGEEIVDADEQSNARQDPPPTLVEWSARTVSAILLLSLFGYICWSALQPTVPTHLDLQVKLEEMRNSGDRFVVPVSVVNMGSQAIEQVSCGIWLKMRDGKTTDHQTLKMTMLGSGERQGFEIWFDHDPKRGTIQHAAENYSL